MCHAAFLDPALDVCEQVLRGAHAGIGHQQGGFKVFVELVVDPAASEDS